MTHIIKYLANLGVASRRKVEQLIREGLVVVNGQVVSNPALIINPEKDEIKIDGKKIEGNPTLIYVALNKPKGIISTASDEQGRRTVLDLVKVKERVYPVGRLDEDSSGLILLTNDGALANYLTHPRYEIPKTYQVAVTGRITSGRLNKLHQGVVLKEGKTAPAEIQILNTRSKQTLLEITIHEGWNHQVRRMCGVIGLNVSALKRVAIGTLWLGDLKWGEWRYLTVEEVKKLKSNS